MSGHGLLASACLAVLLIALPLAADEPAAPDTAPGPRVIPSASTPTELNKLAGVPGAAPNAENSFRFAVLSDRTGRPEGRQWEKAIDQINLLRPDFVMSVGDYIDGYTGDADEINRQWDEIDGILGRLQAPFFFCPGNHDVINGLRLQIYNRRYGVNERGWYSFDYRGCHFLVLDSTTYQTDELLRDEQKAWMMEDLKAAKQADHVFIFYHQPMPMTSDFTQAIRLLLDPRKTTIFNGHNHVLSYYEDQGFPVYVLASSGAAVGVENRGLGALRLVAQVTVSEGRPAVALLPVGDVLPGDHVRRDFVEAFGKMVDATKVRPVPAADGSWAVALKLANPTEAPATLSARWEGRQAVEPAAAAQVLGLSGTGGPEPATAQWTIAPAETVEQSFVVRPWAFGPGPLAEAALLPGPDRLVVRYGLANPREQLVEMEESYPLPGRLAMPRLPAVVIDGQLDEWADVKPTHVSGIEKIDIPADREAWEGPADLSYDVRVAVAGDRLCVAVDVTDDLVNIEGPTFVYKDGIKLFWDARPVERQDGLYAGGTGQVTLAVPPPGEAPRPQYDVGHRVLPKGMQAACRRREGGYVMELSIPLKELGAAGELQSGQSIRLDVMVTDRDAITGTGPLTRMIAFGGRAVNRSTATQAFAVVP